MISSAAEYEFVTGIQDGEIVIDGDILPVRDTYQDPEGIQQPRCLRGEDVAFLMEAANERNGVIAGQAEVTAFGRKVSGGQLATICTNLHRHVRSGSASQPCYFKKEFQFEEKSIAVLDSLPEWEYYADREDIAPARLYGGGVMLDKSASPGDFGSKGALVLSNVRKLFTDVARQRRMYCGDQHLTEGRRGPDGEWYDQEFGTLGGITSTFDRTVHIYGPGSESFEPAYGPFDDSNILFFNEQWAYLSGIYETHTLDSFEMDLQIPEFSANRLSQVTALAVCYARSWWEVGSGSYELEKKMAVIPFAATQTNGKWTLTKRDADSIVDKMAARMSRPIRGSSVWTPGSYNWLEYAMVGLLGVTPIVTLGDHTSF